MLAYSERKESFSMSAPSRYSDLRYMACNPDATASMCRETGGRIFGEAETTGRPGRSAIGNRQRLAERGHDMAGANVG